MRHRVLTVIVAFVFTFGLVYGTLSGGMAVFSRRHVAYVAQNSALKRDFGIPKEWQEQYALTITSELDLKRDSDSDGLTLYDEYTYGTDPANADTDNDGYNDGREVKNGYDPAGEGRMDVNENNIPDTWEMTTIGTLAYGADHDSDSDGLTLYDEYTYGTDPANADTDGDGYNDGREVKNGYDPVMSGDARIAVTIAINKIDVEVPVVFAKSDEEQKLQSDLKYGVIHYPGTAMPGQRGNVYIAGHSSNYAWSQGDFNYVFKRLNEVEQGDVIEIKMLLHNRKEITHRYVVTENHEVAPDDERIFAQTHSKDLTLTTCWPLGSNARRLMVKAVLEDA